MCIHLNHHNRLAENLHSFALMYRPNYVSYEKIFNRNPLNHHHLQCCNEKTFANHSQKEHSEHMNQNVYLLCQGQILVAYTQSMHDMLGTFKSMTKFVSAARKNNWKLINVDSFVPSAIPQDIKATL